MTTIIAIKANSGIEGIVLASDTQLSTYDDEGKLTEKGSTHTKIFYGKGWIMGHAGVFDNQYHQFRRLMSGRKKGYNEDKVALIVRLAIEKYETRPKIEEPHFIEVNYSNTMAKREDPQCEDLHSYLLAVNTPRVAFWEVDEFGSLNSVADIESRDFEYHAIGTGAESALKYIDRLVMKEKLDPKDITIPTAIDVIDESFTEAQSDIFTLGLDLAVITKKGIKVFGKRIEEAVKLSRKQELESIKQEYTDAEGQS